MPPLPHPPEAAMRAMSAGAAWSGALLCAGALGTPSGSGGGSGLVKGPTGVVCAPEAATRATSQVPLRGAGTGGGGPLATAELLHTQPTGSARPGAEHSALGGEPPPPPPPQPPPMDPAGAAAGGGGCPVQAVSLSGSGLMGLEGQLNRPPSPRWQHRPQRQSPATRVPCARFFPG